MAMELFAKRRRAKFVAGETAAQVVQGRFRRVARPHHLLCLFGAVTGNDECKDPR
jgi:hypothetical protein